MKLKLVVASMSIIGFVSCSAFADQAVVKTRHHHKNPHKVTKQQVVTTTTTRADYKDMGSLPVQQATPAACSVSPNSLLLDQMSQNVGRAMPNPCKTGWADRIQFGGGINFDGKVGSREIRYAGENYKRFAINDLYINLSANVNEWAKAFASISYNSLDPVSSVIYSSAYNGNHLNLEQAFVTLGNLDVSPVFAQIGKQYQDFGRYEIHPITESTTQAMTESLATSIKVGFVSNGFNGSIYGFDTAATKVNDLGLASGKQTTTFGASLGYSLVNDQMGYNVGVGYLNNLMGVDHIATAVSFNHLLNVYTTRVSGLALYGDVNSGPFTISARYAAALQRFNAADLMDDNGQGAKPWTAGIQAGYGFESYGKNQNIYVGYQVSRRAQDLSLPKDRWVLGYNVAVFGDNTLLGAEWDHDRNYSSVAAASNTSKNSNLFTVRAGVKFG